MEALLNPEILSTAVRALAPILLVALGGFISERAGIFNIALEGNMLIGAFAAVWGSYHFESAWAGVAVAVIAGATYSLLLAVIVVSFDGDEFVAGVALNLAAIGITGFLLRLLFDTRGSFDDPRILGLHAIRIPFIDGIPILGELLSGHSALIYLAIAMVPATHWFLEHHVIGLRIRGVGMHPDAAESLGVSAIRMRYLALVLAGLLAGLGGAQLSIGQVTLFTGNMTAGRGWIAVVIVMLAFGSTLRVLTIGAAFTFIIAAGLRLQTSGLPVQLTAAIPFAATLLALVIVYSRQHARAYWLE